MASNIGDPYNTQLVGQSDLSEQDNALIQKLILEEIQGKPAETNLESIYREVKKRVKHLTHTDSIKRRILDMIKSTLHRLQMTLKMPALPADEYSKENDWEVVKLKNRNSEKPSKYEIARTNQLVANDHNNLLALREERIMNENAFQEALLQSKLHLDEQKAFDEELKEALAKSYQEEKSKLLTMLHVQDFDFDGLADQLNKVLPDETAVKYKGTSMIHRSALILAIIELFDHDLSIINAAPFQNHIRNFGQRCLDVGSRVTYKKGIHRKNPSSTFNVPSINDYLVNIEIKGDGNCMWSSISHSIVGDYTMMESLRLLTANTLMQHSDKFSEIFTRQTSKFSYNVLTLEQLAKASVSLQTWGDEFHLIALSLALKRPIYSYGSLKDIPQSASMGYEQFRQSYEIESFPNHFKFIGDANDVNNEPILLHYDGCSHYSSVLKTADYVKPLVPYIQIIDALFNGNEMAQPDEAVKLVDTDSDMTEMVPNVEVGCKGNKSDYMTDDDDDGGGKSDEIAKLNKDLRETTRLLQQYESFFQQVKIMLVTQKIDLRKMQRIVEEVENSRR